jgi:uncharacterized GH25 family protein
MKPFHFIAATAACAVTVVSTAASAHGIWFAQRARHLALVYGEGADDLDAVKRLPMITAVTGYDAAWTPIDTSLRVAGPIPVVDSKQPLAAVAAVMDYGLWSRTADGKWHNKGRDQVPDAISAGHNWKYAVHLAQNPIGDVPLLAGHTLQLVPVGAAIPQVRGKTMMVRAYFQGQPQAGVEIISDSVNDPDQRPIKTRADGTARVVVRNQGLNVLMAIHIGPSDDQAKVDNTEHRATLSFVLPHKPE